MVSGECNCGSVAFEIDAPVSDVIICHCSICRRATGTNGIAVVLVNNDDFRWKQGESLVTIWRKPDADWHIGFCSRCGSPLPASSNESMMFVPAGLLSADSGELSVTHHIFVDSRASWDEIGDAGRQHPGRYME